MFHVLTLLLFLKAVFYIFGLSIYRTKFMNDDWMLERKFFDVQEMISEKSLWSVALYTL